MAFLKRTISKLTLLLLIVLVTIDLIQTLNNSLQRAQTESTITASTSSNNQSQSLINQNKILSNNESQFIFIGGFARSGTTLMNIILINKRAILDVHPNIKCGPETKVIPTFLKFAKDYTRSNPELKTDLENAGLKLNLIDSAIVDFITNIMKNRGFKAPRLCAKDPDILLYMDYLHLIFPKAKFIYMIRDGRAAAYSLTQQLEEGSDFFKFRDHLASWVFYNQQVKQNCELVGESHCIAVKYEDLVLQPEKFLKKILNFLGENWTSELLNHHLHIGKDIVVSKTEWSTHQIIKPIHSNSVNAWKKKANFSKSQIGFIEPILIYFNYTFEMTSSNHFKNELIKSLNDKFVNK